jgi:phage shock protein A
MSGLRDASSFETFDRMAQKIDQIEAEAEAQTDLAKEMSGDTLAAQFENLERNQGGEEDLVALKRKMGILPAEEVAPAPPVQVQARVVDAQSPAPGDQEELAAALAELESEGSAQQKVKAQR